MFFKGFGNGANVFQYHAHDKARLCLRDYITTVALLSLFQISLTEPPTVQH